MSLSRRPRRIGAVLSVLVAAAAVAVVATGSGQRLALLVGTVGALGLWAGLHRSKTSLDGVLLALVALGVVGVGLAFGVVRTGNVRGIVEVVPGVLGLAVLGAAVAPLRRGRERLLVSVGTGLVMLNVLISGAIRGASTFTLLAAAAATVAAWDLAEQAVNLSEHVGEAAEAHRAELVHGGATAGFAGVAVGATVFVRGVDVSGLPLVAVLFLLGAAVTLTLVLYN